MEKETSNTLKQFGKELGRNILNDAFPGLGSFFRIEGKKREDQSKYKRNTSELGYKIESMNVILRDNAQLLREELTHSSRFISILNSIERTLGQEASSIPNVSPRNLFSKNRRLSTAINIAKSFLTPENLITAGALAYVAYRNYSETDKNITPEIAAAKSKETPSAVEKLTIKSDELKYVMSRIKFKTDEIIFDAKTLRRASKEDVYSDEGGSTYGTRPEIAPGSPGMGGVTSGPGMIGTPSGRTERPSTGAGKEEVIPSIDEEKSEEGKEPISSESPAGDRVSFSEESSKYITHGYLPKGKNWSGTVFHQTGTQTPEEELLFFKDKLRREPNPNNYGYSFIHKDPKTGKYKLIEASEPRAITWHTGGKDPAADWQSANQVYTALAHMGNFDSKAAKEALESGVFTKFFADRPGSLDFLTNHADIIRRRGGRDERLGYEGGAGEGAAMLKFFSKPENLAMLRKQIEEYHDSGKIANKPSPTNITSTKPPAASPDFSKEGQLKGENVVPETSVTEPKPSSQNYDPYLVGDSQAAALTGRNAGGSEKQFFTNEKGSTRVGVGPSDTFNQLKSLLEQPGMIEKLKKKGIVLSPGSDNALDKSPAYTKAFQDMKDLLDKNGIPFKIIPPGGNKARQLHSDDLEKIFGKDNMVDTSKVPLSGDGVHYNPSQLDKAVRQSLQPTTPSEVVPETKAITPPPSPEQVEKPSITGDFNRSEYGSYNDPYKGIKFPADMPRPDINSLSKEARIFAATKSRQELQKLVNERWQKTSGIEKMFATPEAVTEAINEAVAAGKLKATPEEIEEIQKLYEQIQEYDKQQKDKRSSLMPEESTKKSISPITSNVAEEAKDEINKAQQALKELNKKGDSDPVKEKSNEFDTEKSGVSNKKIQIQTPYYADTIKKPPSLSPIPEPDVGISIC